jgi:hypothetical protein
MHVRNTTLYGENWPPPFTTGGNWPPPRRAGEVASH